MEKLIKKVAHGDWFSSFNMFHVFLEKQYMYEPTLIFLIFIKSGRVLTYKENLNSIFNLILFYLHRLKVRLFLLWHTTPLLDGTTVMIILWTLYSVKKTVFCILTLRWQSTNTHTVNFINIKYCVMDFGYIIF